MVPLPDRQGAELDLLSNHDCSNVGTVCFEERVHLGTWWVHIAAVHTQDVRIMGVGLEGTQILSQDFLAGMRTCYGDHGARWVTMAVLGVPNVGGTPPNDPGCPTASAHLRGSAWPLVAEHSWWSAVAEGETPDVRYHGQAEVPLPQPSGNAWRDPSMSEPLLETWPDEPVVEAGPEASIEAPFDSELMESLWEPLTLACLGPLMAVPPEPSEETSPMPVLEAQSEPLVEDRQEPLLAVSAEPLVKPLSELVMEAWPDPVMETPSEPLTEVPEESPVAVSSERLMEAGPDPVMEETSLEPLMVISDDSLTEVLRGAWSELWGQPWSMPVMEPLIESSRERLGEVRPEPLAVTPRRKPLVEGLQEPLLAVSAEPLVNSMSELVMEAGPDPLMEAACELSTNVWEPAVGPSEKTCSGSAADAWSGIWAKAPWERSMGASKEPLVGPLTEASPAHSTESWVGTKLVASVLKECLEKEKDNEPVLRPNEQLKVVSLAKTGLLRELSKHTMTDLSTSDLSISDFEGCSWRWLKLALLVREWQDRDQGGFTELIEKLEAWVPRPVGLSETWFLANVMQRVISSGYLTRWLSPAVSWQGGWNCQKMVYRFSFPDEVVRLPENEESVNRVCACSRLYWWFHQAQKNIRIDEETWKAPKTPKPVFTVQGVLGKPGFDDAVTGM
ncbi:putative Pc-fam-6, partial [Gregarina niphandrodes]